LCSASLRMVDTMAASCDVDALEGRSAVCKQLAQLIIVSTVRYPRSSVGTFQFAGNAVASW
jgi:hypothetical protein